MKKTVYKSPRVYVSHIELHLMIVGSSGNRVNGIISGGVSYDDPGLGW